MMDKKRQGEIAFLLLKQKLRETGIRLSAKAKTDREIGNTAKSIGIDIEEAMEFAEIIIREMVDEAFPKC